METAHDFGFITNIEVIQQLVAIEGRFVIDAGCGAMAMTRQLASNGANVLAIDPDPVQAQKNRVADSIANVEFVETGADRFPVQPKTVDGIFFSYSLHHIPAGLYPAVFAECKRVLKPDGFLYVIEPTSCPLNDVMMLFHDEESARAEAQVALHQLAAPLFESVAEYTYHGYRQFESWDDFATQFASKSFNPNYTEADVRRKEVQQLFEQLGAPDYRFTSPKRVMCLKRPIR